MSLGRPAASGARRWGGRCALLLAPFLLLFALEGALRLVDPAPEDLRWKDPYLRRLLDAQGRPLLDEDGKALLSNEPTAAADPVAEVGARRFAAQPRPGVTRVFSIGASTTYGLKYAPRASYTRFLAGRLWEHGGDSLAEVVNLGISGYDSHDLPRLTEELLEYRPDVLLVYAGHNELKYPNLARVLRPWTTELGLWLRRFALTWRFFRETPAPPVPPELTEQPLLDRAARERALDRYEQALRSIVRGARGRGVEVFLCTPVSNVRDKVPRQSELPAGCEAELRAELEALRDLLHPERRPPQPLQPWAEQELERVKGWSQRLPETSLVAYLRGRLLFLLGRHEEARAQFLRSRELDRLPERAWPALVQRVREVASSMQVPLVDLEARFAQEAEGGIAGFDLFFDYCHPNLRGHWLIADEILLSLRSHSDHFEGLEEVEPPQQQGFEGWCQRFGVDETMGTLQQAREFLGQAAAREGAERQRLLAVVEEFAQAVVRDRASSIPDRAEAWALRGIAAALAGQAADCQAALRQSGALSMPVREQLLRRVAANAALRERFAAVGVVVDEQGRIVEGGG